MELKVVTFAVFVGLLETAFGDDDLLVTVRQGSLVGIEKKNKYTNESYYAFLGVPYAKPPVGEKRFKDPEEPVPWNGILNATQEGPSCMTYNLLFKYAEGSEDCLHLFIYSNKKPKELQDSLRPVMVWIHGGGFLQGSGRPSDYGPDFLVQHDIILVTINYRLNVFGFLSVQTDNVPGNAGLKDQVQALKWIQENIKQFGGDPTSVTVFGESAGGSSVHYLMLSPMAKGLFHRAIAQSGVALNPWASTKDTQNLAFKIGEVFDCNTKNTYELVDCLQQVKAKELVSYQYNVISFKASEFLMNSLSVPCVEPEHAKKSFLTQHPMKLMEEGKFNDVPFLLGFMQYETLLIDKLFSEEAIPSSIRNLVINQINKFPHLLLPRNLVYESKEKAKEIGQKMKQFYFLDQAISNETVENLINATTDGWFLLGIHQTAKLHAQIGKSPVYFYDFTLETKFGESEKQIAVNRRGPSHAEDLKYFFNIWNKRVDIPPEEVDKIHQIQSFWVNFAKFGNPTPESSFSGLTWEQLTPEKPSYLEIGDEFNPKLNCEKERMDFWENVIKEEHLNYY